MHTVTISREGLLRFGFSELERPSWRLKNATTLYEVQPIQPRLYSLKLPKNNIRPYSPARKREQRHGRCKCPAEYSWTCNADCLVCPFHVQGDTTSLEELTEHGEEWNTLEVSQAEDTPLEDDLIACSQMLDLLIARFRELDPEADHIIEMMEQGLSDRKIAEALGRKQRTFADQMKKIRRELNRLSKD